MTPRDPVKHYCYFEGTPDWSGGVVWARTMTEAARLFAEERQADPQFEAVVVMHQWSSAKEVIPLT